jgi:hypothetical protein
MYTYPYLYIRKENPDRRGQPVVNVSGGRLAGNAEPLPIPVGPIPIASGSTERIIDSVRSDRFIDTPKR